MRKQWVEKAETDKHRVKRKRVNMGKKIPFHNSLLLVVAIFHLLLLLHKFTLSPCSSDDALIIIVLDLFSSHSPLQLYLKVSFKLLRSICFPKKTACFQLLSCLKPLVLVLSFSVSYSFLIGSLYHDSRRPYRSFHRNLEIYQNG